MQTRHGNPSSPPNPATDGPDGTAATTAGTQAAPGWGEQDSPYNLNPPDGSLDTLVGTYLIDDNDPDYLERFYTNGRMRVSVDGVLDINVSALSPEAQTLAIEASAAWALLLDESLVVTDAAEDVSIMFSNDEDDDGYATGWFGNTGVVVDNKYHDVLEGGVNVPASWSAVSPATKYAYVHEVGHALRLDHPGLYAGSTFFNGEPLDRHSDQVFDNDNTRLSVMSYFRPLDAQGNELAYYAVTPMVADMVTVDRTWGLTDSALPGDTTYGVGADTGLFLDEIFAAMAEPGNPYALTLYDTGGHDTLDFSDHDATVHGQPLRLNLNPFWTSDVYSTPGNLVIGPKTWIEAAIGSPGDDHITGNSIDNHLAGGAGDDTLLGGPGDDVLVGGPGADVLDGHSGQDTASYAGSPSRVDVRLSGTVVNFGDATGDRLIAIEHLVGSAYNDTLAGDGRANVIDGGAGNDLVWGSGGNDRLIGGPGADRLVGGHGRDVAEFTHSPAGVTINLGEATLAGGDAQGDRFSRMDTLKETDSQGNETTIELPDIEGLLGSAYADTLIGDRRANPLDGGPGDDVLAGLDGADTLTGGPGSDTADYSASKSGVTVRLHSLAAAGGDAQGDSFGQTVAVQYTGADGLVHTDRLPDIENLTGSAMRDVLAGDRRDNVLKGGDGHDTLYGGPGGGDDVMEGGPGNDKIYGGAGADTLVGGPGDDTLVPGAGTDTLVFGPGDGNDTVLRFDAAQDRIDLTGFELTADFTPELRSDGDNTVLSLAQFDGGEIVFEGVSLDENTATFIV